MKKLIFESFGCRMNHAQGEALAEQLQLEHGWTLHAVGGEGEHSADEVACVVVNSCTITHEAGVDARRSLGRARKRWPGAHLVLTGCHAEIDGESLVRQGLVDELLRRVPEGYARAESASKTRETGSPGAQLVSLRRPREVPAQAQRSSRARAELPIQDGCNYRCSFCIVPKVRGRNRSRPMAELVEVAQELGKRHPEIVLTGIHLGTYGWDIAAAEGRHRSERDLAQLLSQLHGGLRDSGCQVRIRLGSLDPHELKPSLVAAMAAAGDRQARHLHLCVQSGSDAVLRRMRRAHRREDFEQALVALSQALPGITIGTDVIAGFPGESDDDFEASYALHRDAPIHYAHVFTYSERPGTEAAELGQVVPMDERRRRSRALRQLMQTKWRSYEDSFEGRELELIVERTRRLNGSWRGISSEYLRVELDSDMDLGGRRVQARVHSRAGGGPLRATLCSLG